MNKNSKVVLSIIFIAVFCLLSYCIVQINETQQGIMMLTQELAMEVHSPGKTGTITPEHSAESVPSPSVFPSETPFSPPASPSPSATREVTLPDLSSLDEASSQETIAPEHEGPIVYWVPNGKVYHTTPNCSTLSRSNHILSGTIAESGKPRVCKKCG